MMSPAANRSDLLGVVCFNSSSRTRTCRFIDMPVPWFVAAGRHLGQVNTQCRVACEFVKGGGLRVSLRPGKQGMLAEVSRHDSLWQQELPFLVISHARRYRLVARSRCGLPFNDIGPAAPNEILYSVYPDVGGAKEVISSGSGSSSKTDRRRSGLFRVRRPDSVEIRCACVKTAQGTSRCWTFRVPPPTA